MHQLDATAEGPRAEGPPTGRASTGLALGRYRLLEQLGAGGFGVVWRAHDQLLDREVAVKRIALMPGGDGDRATREALAAARLSHPAIVTLYEAATEGDGFFLVSELVRGRTLAAALTEQLLFDDDVLAVGLAILGALDHAHARGVIHRDVKPGNVLVVDEPDPRGAVAKLTDFGGAALTGEQTLTRTGDVVGTLAYMAPEQADGREAGEQADLYSLSLVLYEALAGVNPVRGATPAQTARRLGRRVPSLAAHRPELPDDAIDAIDAALEPDPRRRGSLKDLHDGLLAAQAQLAEQTTGGRPSSRRGRPRRPAATPTATHRFDPGTDAPPASVLAQPSPHPVRPAFAPRPEIVDADPDRPGLRRSGWPARSLGALAGGALVAAALAGLGASGAPAALAGGALTVASLLVAPRIGWLAAVTVTVAWLAADGHAGSGLLIVAAALPATVLLPAVGPSRSLAALAPALGVIGLAGAFPAVPGQWRQPRARAALGALGYWWLLLAQPLLGRRLWLWPLGGRPAAALLGSATGAATHGVWPLLTLATLAGATLWAAAAVILPWIVRGRSVARDTVAAVTWAAGLAAAAGALQRSLGSQHAVAPRGLVLGAVLAGAMAVVARGLRGPD